MKRFLLLFIVLSAPCFAADTAILPDKPEPQYQGKIHTADREFWIETAAFGTAWTLDGISTHNADPRAREAGIFFHGSRSTIKIMGAWAAVDVGAAVVAYEWKKHVRNRYLHPLWRVPMLAGTLGHDYSAIGNWSLGKGMVPMETTTGLPGSSTAPDLRVRQIAPSPLRVPRRFQP